LHSCCSGFYPRTADGLRMALCDVFTQNRQFISSSSSSTSAAAANAVPDVIIIPSSDDADEDDESGEDETRVTV